MSDVVIGLPGGAPVNRRARRWDITESERAVAHAVEEEWTIRELVSTLIRAPHLAPQVVKLALRGAMTGIWSDVELGILLDSERVRQTLDGTMRGAAWSPDRTFIDALLPWLEPSAEVLEIGCGVGRIARQVAPKVGRLTFSDVSRVMIREARINLAEYPNASSLQTRGYWLEGIPDASFDLVYAHAVFVFFDLYPAIAMLDAARRVLREGGTCVIGFYTMDKSEWAQEAVLAARRYSSRGRFGARASRAYTEAHVRAMYEAVGFQMIESIEGPITADDPHPATIFTGTATRPRPGVLM